VRQPAVKFLLIENEKILQRNSLNVGFIYLYLKKLSVKNVFPEASRKVFSSPKNKKISFTFPENFSDLMSIFHFSSPKSFRGT